MKVILKIVRDLNLILAVYSLLAIIAALQEYHLGAKSSTFTHYNNFIIFKLSFIHLIQHRNLYALYPNEYFDYYKYSPSFAMAMALFAYLPDAIGLILWNLLNAVVLFVAIKSLPVQNKGIVVAIAWFVVVEMMTSLQNSQTNPLIGGVLILAFSFLERRKILIATLMISLTVFIKIFGIVAFSLILLYPDKKRFFWYSAMWMVLLAAAPVILISFSQLIAQYQNWWHLLNMDYQGSLGFSVMGWLHTWFHFDPPKNLVALAGIIFLCLPLVFYKRFSDENFRRLFFCNLLVWMVIFNHKAESATFIIAICGVAIWYFTEQKNYLNLILVLLAFIFTCLSPTDLFPRTLRDNVIVPYTLKAVPCILIWGKIIWELITASYKQNRRVEESLGC